LKRADLKPADCAENNHHPLFDKSYIKLDRSEPLSDDNKKLIHSLWDENLNVKQILIQLKLKGVVVALYQIKAVCGLKANGPRKGIDLRYNKRRES
jgi:hypothetical protein